MSNFKCEKCGTNIIDTPDGYTGGCEHYPVEGESGPFGNLDIAPLEWETEDELPDMTGGEFRELFMSSRLSPAGGGVRMYPFVRIGGEPVWVSGLDRLYDFIRREYDRNELEWFQRMTDIREACRDDGKRMIPDLIEYLEEAFEALSRIAYDGVSRSDCVDAARKALETGEGGKFIVTVYSTDEEGHYTPEISTRTVGYDSLDDLLFHEHPYEFPKTYSSLAELVEETGRTVREAIEDEEDANNGILVYKVGSDGEQASEPVFSDIG